ncbi:MAG: hypothetical protein H6713_23605 [Myxococcales bacterium]|nr:hypothetical protein [Myxococcales bacterium]MCB9752952.1 hypothetical protein [Myxococcales bacterium]
MSRHIELPLRFCAPIPIGHEIMVVIHGARAGSDAPWAHEALVVDLTTGIEYGTARQFRAPSSARFEDAPPFDELPEDLPVDEVVRGVVSRCRVLSGALSDAAENIWTVLRVEINARTSPG